MTRSPDSLGAGKVDADFGAGAGRDVDADRSAEALYDVLGDGEAKPCATALGREIGIEDVGQVRWLDADTAIGDDDRDAIAACARPEGYLRGGAVRPGGVIGAVDRVARVDQHVHERNPQA